MNTVRPTAILTANAMAALDDCIVVSSSGASQIPERLIVDSKFEGEGDIWIHHAGERMRAKSSPTRSLIAVSFLL